jgi:membrane protease YdiL (CAAX protease family)
MTPYLTERLGRTKGLILAGCLWAIWHWPLILCGGYEYGTGYWGAPFTGMLLMCAATTALGILLSFLYDKSGSIWAPALAHGAVNAAAGIGILFLRADVTSLFPGPTPFGLVAGIPLFALAAWALLRKPEPEGEPEE